MVRMIPSHPKTIVTLKRNTVQTLNMSASAPVRTEMMENNFAARRPSFERPQPSRARAVSKHNLRIALVTNHPPPFRTPIYERIAADPNVAFHAIFCSRREPNREWEIPSMTFEHHFLKERFVARGSNFIHNNPDVISALNVIRPDVIVTTGFNPTHLYAFGYSVARGIPHVPMTDGTAFSEAGLSAVHKLIRRIVYARSSAFIAASQGGLHLYQGYGIAAAHCFQSCLCIDNTAYDEARTSATPHDLIFCGRIVTEKNPDFALHVAAQLAMRLGRRVSLLFVGSGEAEEAIRAMADQHPELIDAHFHGHAEQDELPSLYNSAKLFLFPTQADVWGVVANEACAAGLPILVSEHAGVAGELIVDSVNGYVLPLDVELWAEKAANLLTDAKLYQRFSDRSRTLVDRYTFDRAAEGIINACRHAAGKKSPARTKPANR